MSHLLSDKAQTEQMSCSQQLRAAGLSASRGTGARAFTIDEIRIPRCASIFFIIQNRVQDQPDTGNYNITKNKSATPINAVGTLFIVNMLAFVDCATAGPGVREGAVMFEDGRSGWLALLALAPLPTLAALAIYALKVCGPDVGL